MNGDAILFQDYSYGAIRQEIVERAKAGSCPEGLASPLNLCSPQPIEFLEAKWQEVFSFNNQDELQQIMLVKGGKADLDGTLEKLIEIGWQPVLLETDDTVLDVLDEAKRDGIAAAEKAGKNL